MLASLTSPALGFLPAYLLSRPDRLSTGDRRSPMSAFSFSDRVSIPNRLSLVPRLSAPARFFVVAHRVPPLAAENHRG